MSKYTVGDKFVVEIEEVYNGNLCKMEEHMHLYRIKGFKSLVFDENGLDKLQKCETELSWDEAYIKGLNDAWELARKISEDYNTTERAKIFGYGVSGITVKDILRDFAPQEALAKLEAYEKEQNEIKVGDVVINEDAGTKGVVAKVRDEIIYVLFRDGSAGKHEKTDFKMTGKHIDIQKLLDELKEGTE